MSSASTPAGDAPPQAHGSGFASHFVESVLLTWLSSLARIGIGMVALRLVTGSIPEAALGAYWILTSMAALLANFADLGVGIGAVRHLPIAPDPARARSLMQTTVLLRLTVLAALCGVIFACRPGLLRLFGADAMASHYHYLYAFVVVTSCSDLYTSFLQGLNRFRVIAALALVSSLGRLVMIVVFVRVMGLGVDGLFLAEVLSLLLVVVISVAVSAHGWQLRYDRVQGRRQLHFGLPLYANTLLAYTAGRINTVMIGSMTGSAAVSYFTVASRIPDQLGIVMRSYVSVYLPNMTRLLVGGDRVAAERLLASSLRLMSYCFAMLTLVLTFFRREVLLVLAPESYQVGALAVPLLAGGMAFGVLGLIMGHTLVAIGDSRTPVKINFWTSLFLFALNFFCIQRWGFIGAAWASFVFNVVAYAVTDIVLSRRIRPAGRSYLGILLFLAMVLAAGMNAGLALRIAALAIGAGGSLLLSRDLRRDLLQVWKVRGRNRAASPAIGSR